MTTKTLKPSERPRIVGWKRIADRLSITPQMLRRRVRSEVGSRIGEIVRWDGLIGVPFVFEDEMDQAIAACGTFAEMVETAGTLRRYRKASKR